ncbi:MAG: DHH family phosphoesterase [Thermoplasmata archaeon]
MKINGFDTDAAIKTINTSIPDSHTAKINEEDNGKDDEGNQEKGCDEEESYNEKRKDTKNKKSNRRKFIGITSLSSFSVLESETIEKKDSKDYECVFLYDPHLHSASFPKQTANISDDSGVIEKYIEKNEEAKNFNKRVKSFITQAELVARFINRFRKILVITHIDADGITSGAIMSLALDEAGKIYSIIHTRQIDPELISSAAGKLKEERFEAVMFLDLGSGSIDSVLSLKVPVAVLDHHQPAHSLEEYPKKTASPEHATVAQLNPHDFGFNGAKDISGSGTSYFVGEHLAGKHWKTRDIALMLALTGAVGDIQDYDERCLSGLNRLIVEKALDAGILAEEFDASFFGRQTREIYKVLQFSTDPPIPSLTGRASNCVQFLEELGIPSISEDGHTTWSTLDIENKRKILSRIVLMLLKRGYSSKAVDRLFSYTYTFPSEPLYSPTRDAKEFATLLNSCGRYQKAEVGHIVARGDRTTYYEEALSLLRNHRKTLVEAMKKIEDIGLDDTTYTFVQYFHSGSEFPETIVGTVANMLLGTGNLNTSKILVGFAFCEDDPENVKVSARTTKNMVEKGIHLAEIMRYAAQKVGGVGGGHNIAAGALIRKGKEEEFLKAVEEKAAMQLKK